MTLKRALMVLVLTALAALSGCDKDGGHPHLLPDRGLSATYVVTSVTAKGEPHALVKGTQVRIRFADGAMTLTAGCNTMSGKYDLEESRLTVEPLAMTEMGCDRARMDQDTWLAGLFEKPVQLTTGDEPTIVSGSTVLAMADRRTAAPDKPLVGTTWLLDSIGNNGVVGSVPAEPGATLLFTETEVTVSDGCNHGTGPVTITGGSIAFGDIAMTMLPCPTVRGDVSGALRAVVHGTVAYEIEENHLTLTRGDESLGLTAMSERLVGNRWRLDTVYDGDAASSVPAGVKAWVYFDSRGRVRLNDGCNVGHGRFTVSGEKLTARIVDITAVLCRGPDFPNLVGLLTGTATYSIDGSSLRITNGNLQYGFHTVETVPQR